MLSVFKLFLVIEILQQEMYMDHKCPKLPLYSHIFVFLLLRWRIDRPVLHSTVT